MAIPEILRITDDFPAVSLDDWRAKAEADLKGKPLAKLSTRLYEGISLEPLCTAENSPAAGSEGLPGLAPLCRGGHPLGRVREGWAIRQQLDHPSIATANRQALADLDGGANALGLRFHAGARLRGGDAEQAEDLDGLAIHVLGDLEVVLRNVRIDWIELALDSGAAFLETGALLLALYDHWDIAKDDARGELGADPIGTLASNGSLPQSLDEACADAAALAAWCAERRPNLRALTASTRPYHEAGADAAVEIAAAIATGVAYLRACEAQGLSPAQAASQITLEVALGCDQFLEIAKLRALRSVWSRVLAACGVATADQALRISACTGDRMQTRVDPWVNMLRGTVATFAAAVGGVDSLAVAPFDSACGESADSARRIARNTQIVLAEESHLARIVDPGGGSWFLEKLSADLTAAAWAAFTDIEAQGGIASALASGNLQAGIVQTAAARNAAIAKRKEPITGVSEFPNIDEGTPATATVDREELCNAAVVRCRQASDNSSVDAALARCKGTSGAERVAAAIAAMAKGASIGALASVMDHGQQAQVTALAAFRRAAVFEALRQRALAVEPTAFLANIGPIARHTVRATWSRNLLGAGGIAAIDQGGFDQAQAMADAFIASKAPIACICGTDDDYAEQAAAIATALKAAGAKRVVLAGKPADEATETAYRQAGIDQFIHIGCSVADILDDLLSACEGAQA